MGGLRVTKAVMDNLVEQPVGMGSGVVGIVVRRREPIAVGIRLFPIRLAFRVLTVTDSTLFKKICRPKATSAASKVGGTSV